MAGPKDLATATQAQIFLGDHKSIVDLAENIEAGFRGVGERTFIEQHAGRLRRTAPNAAAQLMKLRKPEHLGILDDYHRRVWDVWWPRYISQA